MSEKVTKLKLHKMKDTIALITIVAVNYLVIVWPVGVLHPVDLVPLSHVHAEILCYAILTWSFKILLCFYFNTVSRLLIIYNFIYLDNYLLQDSHVCSSGKSWCMVMRIYTLWSFEPCQTHLHVVTSFGLVVVVVIIWFSKKWCLPFKDFMYVDLIMQVPNRQKISQMILKYNVFLNIICMPQSNRARA